MTPEEEKDERMGKHIAECTAAKGLMGLILSGLVFGVLIGLLQSTCRGEL